MKAKISLKLFFSICLILGSLNTQQMSNFIQISNQGRIFQNSQSFREDNFISNQMLERNTIYFYIRIHELIDETTTPRDSILNSN